MKLSDRARLYRSFGAMSLIHYSPRSGRHEINRKNEEFGPENRAEKTPAEARMEKILHDLGISFRREVAVPVDGKIYFLDFVIGQPHWIAVELDGGVHKNRREYDNERDIEIMGLTGWTILRFENNEVGEVIPVLLAQAMLEILPIEKQLGNFPPKRHEAFLRVALQKASKLQSLSTTYKY